MPTVHGQSSQSFSGNLCMIFPVLCPPPEKET